MTLISALNKTFTPHYFSTRDDWLAFRQTGIGGSDAPAVMGTSPWESAYSLACKKLGLAPPEPETERMRWGRLLEPVMLQEMRETTGWRIEKGTPVSLVTLRADAFPYMLHTYDGIISTDQAPVSDVSGPGLLECKDSGVRDEDELADPESAFRRMVDVQVQHGLAVTGWSWAVVAVLIGGYGGHRLRWYAQKRDEALIDRIVSAEGTFWERLQRGEMPAADGSEATGKALRQRHPKDNGKAAVLDGQMLATFRTWQEETAALEEHQHRAQEARNRLVAAIGDCTHAVLPNGQRLTYRAREGGGRVLRAERR